MMQELQGGYIKTEYHKGIAVIEFFHPSANSLPAALLAALTQEIHSAAMEADVKVVVIKSSGDGAFCSGASFDELLNILSEKEGKEFFSGFANLINAMRKCPKMIIVRVQGKAVGGGLGIIAAADYAIACEGCDVKLSELTIGIGPFVVGPAIERKIGISAFSQLAIDAALWRPADWARRKGLYAELHPDVTGMDESVDRLANSLAQANPEAVSEMKKIFWKGTEHWDGLLAERAAISGRLAVSSFTKNSLRKFRDKK
ncbi:MAG: enoyl-CoA hydratase/isomerase family protein [Chitinophagaceae bacterium]|nr:enoyl-CoA hydratase/isomerase family protein [Chitinophagaceae bacterium]MCW5925278.1 enoyl-CoA hydratase/isomerase family protein [Chitinophagaceae bacterium]